MGDMRVIVQSPVFARSKAFYQNVLKAEMVEEWAADEVQPAGAIMRVSSGGCVELVEARMAHDGLRIGVELDNPADVDAIHQRLVDADTAIITPPTDQPWNHRNCTAVTPEGTMITFYAHL